MCFLILLLSLAFQACLSYTSAFQNSKSLIQSQNYEKALEQIENLTLLQKEENAVLKQMEMGSLHFLMEQWDPSLTFYQKASRSIERAPLFDVSDQIESFLKNDQSLSYSSQVEDYEQVLLAIQMLIGVHLEKQNINRQEPAVRYLIETIDRVYEASDEQKKDVQSVKTCSYTLAGLTYLKLKAYDKALIAFRQALGKSPQKRLTPTLCQLALWSAEKDRQEINLTSLCGQEKPLPTLTSVHIVAVDWIPHKENLDFFIPIKEKVYRLSFPAIPPSYQFVPPQWRGHPLLGDTGQWAQASLERKRLKAIAKMGTRLIAKRKISQVLEDQFGLLGFLLGQIYLIFSETGDTRGWNLLPRAFYLVLNDSPTFSPSIVYLNKSSSSPPFPWSHSWISLRPFLTQI